MRKHLTRLGNSLALVVERPILVMLGITANTELKVYTDGFRIIVEPVQKQIQTDDEPSGADRIGTGLSFEQRLIPAYQTWKKYGFAEHFKALGEGRVWLDYLCRLKHRMPDEWTMRVMDRVEVCCDELDDSKSWDEAIAAALAEVPVPIALPQLPAEMATASRVAR